MRTDPHAFIVRIWIDADTAETASPQWHGVIAQVGSQEHLYFFDLDSIKDYIQEHAGLPPQRPYWYHRFRLWLRHASHAILRQRLP